MEKDNEVKGSGNSYDFGARMHDPRTGRWLSTDNLSTAYPGFSPYNYSLNNPIYYVDKDGNYIIPADSETEDDLNDAIYYHVGDNMVADMLINAVGLYLDNIPTQKEMKKAIRGADLSKDQIAKAWEWYDVISNDEQGTIVHGTRYNPNTDQIIYSTNPKVSKEREIMMFNLQEYGKNGTAEGEAREIGVDASSRLEFHSESRSKFYQFNPLNLYVSTAGLGNVTIHESTIENIHITENKYGKKIVGKADLVFYGVAREKIVGNVIPANTPIFNESNQDVFIPNPNGDRIMFQEPTKNNGKIYDEILKGIQDSMDIKTDKKTD